MLYIFYIKYGTKQIWGILISKWTLSPMDKPGNTKSSSGSVIVLRVKDKKVNKRKHEDKERGWTSGVSVTLWMTPVPPVCFLLFDAGIKWEFDACIQRECVYCQ